MGLDVSHDCWSGSYSAFSRFRIAIASVAGIDLGKMDGFGGDTRWGSLPSDALHVLLNHSDCDGEIAAEHLLPLAQRLEQLIPALKTYDAVRPGSGHLMSVASAAKQFANGLRLAAENQEIVTFG